MTPRRSGRRGIPPADRYHRRLLPGVVGAVALSVALGGAVGGCADSAALGLVRQACGHVQRSLTFYRASESATNPTTAARDRNAAQSQLETAAPLAAEAAGEAPQWQALMATLSENSRLPEANLVPALQQQCAAVRSGGTPGPTLPPTTLPPVPGS